MEKAHNFLRNRIGTRLLPYSDILGPLFNELGRITANASIEELLELNDLSLQEQYFKYISELGKSKPPVYSNNEPTLPEILSQIKEREDKKAEEQAKGTTEETIDSEAILGNLLNSIGALGGDGQSDLDDYDTSDGYLDDSEDTLEDSEDTSDDFEGYMDDLDDSEDTSDDSEYYTDITEDTDEYEDDNSEYTDEYEDSDSDSDDLEDSEYEDDTEFEDSQEESDDYEEDSLSGDGADDYEEDSDLDDYEDDIVSSSVPNSNYSFDSDYEDSDLDDYEDDSEDDGDSEYEDDDSDDDSEYEEDDSDYEDDDSDYEDDDSEYEEDDSDYEDDDSDYEDDDSEEADSEFEDSDDDDLSDFDDDPEVDDSEDEEEDSDLDDDLGSDFEDIGDDTEDPENDPRLTGYKLAPGVSLQMTDLLDFTDQQIEVMKKNRVLIPKEGTKSTQAQKSSLSESTSHSPMPVAPSFGAPAKKPNLVLFSDKNVMKTVSGFDKFRRKAGQQVTTAKQKVEKEVNKPEEKKSLSDFSAWK